MFQEAGAGEGGGTLQKTIHFTKHVHVTIIIIVIIIIIMSII